MMNVRFPVILHRFDRPLLAEAMCKNVEQPLAFK